MIESYGDYYLDNVPGKGRGLFAQREFARGERIVSSPVLVHRDPADVKAVFRSNMSKYVFWWPFDEDGQPDEDSPACATVLGLGSLANHDADFNCRWEFSPELLQHYLIARRTIAAGEELTIDYGWTPDELQPPAPVEAAETAAYAALLRFANTLRPTSELAARKPMGSGSRQLTAPASARRETVVQPAPAARSVNRRARAGTSPDATKAVQRVAEGLVKKFPGLFTNVHLGMTDRGRRLWIEMSVRGSRLSRPTITEE